MNRRDLIKRAVGAMAGAYAWLFGPSPAQKRLMAIDRQIAALVPETPIDDYPLRDTLFKTYIVDAATAGFAMSGVPALNEPLYPECKAIRCVRHEAVPAGNDRWQVTCFYEVTHP